MPINQRKAKHASSHPQDMQSAYLTSKKEEYLLVSKLRESKYEKVPDRGPRMQRVTPCALLKTPEKRIWLVVVCCLNRLGAGRVEVDPGASKCGC